MLEVHSNRGLKIAVVALTLLVVIIAVVLAVVIATGRGSKTTEGTITERVAGTGTTDEAGAGVVGAASTSDSKSGSQSGQSGSQPSGQSGQPPGSGAQPPQPSLDEQTVCCMAMEYAKAPDDTVNWQVVDAEIVYIPQPAGDPEGWALVKLAVPGSGGDPLMVVFRYWGGIWTNIAGGQPLHHSDVPQAPQELFN